MMKRKLMIMAIITVLTVSIISGCGSSAPSDNIEVAETTEKTDTEVAEVEIPDAEAEDAEKTESENTEAENIENEQEQKFVNTESIKRDTDGNISATYSYDYDENGNQVRSEYTLIWDIEADIKTTSVTICEYDINNNKIKQTISPDHGDLDIMDTTETIITTYDNEGNRIAETMLEGDSVFSSDEYTYDSDKDLIKRVSYDENDSLTATEEYIYDSDKNLIEEILYDENGTVTWQVKYEYNSNGEKIKETNDAAILADLYGYSIEIKEYEYDDKHRLSKTTWYGDDILQSKMITEYDDNDNIIKETEYDDKDSVVSITEYEYMLLQDYLDLKGTADNGESDVTEQENAGNPSADIETTDENAKETESIKADTTGRKPITPKEIIFLYDGTTNLEKIYYRTSENASWTLFFDGIAEPGSLISDSSGMITLYEGYFGVKLVFNNGATENIHTINLVEGQVKNYDGSIGTTEYTGEMIEFLITDSSENFLDVDWS